MKKESRKFRRRQDDIESGLLFAWRTPGGSFGRTLVGVFVATVLFAGAASVLRVRIPMAVLPSPEAVQLIVLDPDDELSRELIDWARFHSPYPDRWDPSGTGILEGEMDAIEAALAASCIYESKLLPRIESVLTDALPGLVDLEPYPLPASTAQVTVPLKANIVKSLQAVFRANGVLKDRWGVMRLPWGGKDSSGMVGLESSFLLGVKPDGRIDFCLPLEGAGGDVDEKLQGWLRGQRLEEDAEATEVIFDVVVVRFEETPPEPNLGEEAP